MVSFRGRNGCLPFFALFFSIGVINVGYCQDQDQLCVDWLAGQDEICDVAPEGGLLIPPSTEVPPPLAFFPLTGGSVYSWPQAQVSGVNRGAEWAADDFFGSSVLYCTQGDGDQVLLDNVPYGASTGSFAINLWIRQPTTYATNQGNAYQYIYSHGTTNLVDDFNPQSTNQVHIFLPEQDHQLFGVVRVIVKDSDDSTEVTFLDSDDVFSNNTRVGVQPGHNLLTDGQWHMITVTTERNQRPGFSIYIDGQFAASIPQDIDMGVVDGGSPIYLNSSIHLCGRVDGDEFRHYDGYVTRLSLYDTNLNARQIAALYDEVINNVQTVEAVEVEVSYEDVKVTEDGQDCVFPFIYEGQIHIQCYEVDGIPSCEVESGEIVPCAKPEPVPAVENTVRYTTDGELCEFPLIYKGEELYDCQQSPGGERCVVGGDWKPCAPRDFQFPSGTTVISSLPSEQPDRNDTLPSPFAFFPLEGNLLGSLDGKYNGSGNVEWEDDSRFGIVPVCDQIQGHVIQIDSVPYAQNGGFAVNFWMKWKDMEGEKFQYIYSHRLAEFYDNDQIIVNRDPVDWGPNQIQVYLPEKYNEAHGVVRALLKDGDDQVTPGATGYKVYVDSNGEIADRDTSAEPEVNVEDGSWHMITLTTRTDGKKGYSLYVDAKLGGEVQEGSVYLNADGEQLDIPGGAPMNLSGPIQLCGRYDRNPERDFTGSVTNLRLYDQALNPAQIKRLFEYNGGVDRSPVVIIPNPDISSVAEVIPGYNISETFGPNTIDGRRCSFPFTYQGQTYNECSIINGEYRCMVGDELIACDRTLVLFEPESPSPQPPAAQLTVTGEECSFPLIYQGLVFNECIPVEGEYMCKTADNDTFVPCEMPPVRTFENDNVTVLNLPPDFTVPVVCDLSQGDDECDEGQVCAKVSPKSGGVRYLRNPSEEGICVMPPQSGVLLPEDNPVPLAYFPLSGGLLASWPYDDFQGTSVGVNPVPDPLFKQAYQCQQGESDFITLDSVPYALSGSFSVNLWFKTANMSGDTYQYLYAHSSIPVADNSQRVQIYLPESDHQLYGLMRTLIRDSNDPANLVYADSDNQIANQGYRVIDDFTIVDGEWHMATITTHTDNTPGYSMYVDAVLVADHSAENAGPSSEVFGGDPIYLDDRIYLCGRYDENPARHFDGLITQLSLYDSALTPTQIQALYKIVIPSADIPPPSPLFIGQPQLDIPTDLDRSQCNFPFVYRGVRFMDCAPVDGAYICQSSENRNQLVECNETGIKPCNSVQPDACTGNQVCGKLTLSSSAIRYFTEAEHDGICAEPPASGVLLPDDIPVPIAYFPLSGESLSSWPHADYGGNSRGVEMVADELFSSAYECKQGANDYLSFDTVPYAENGSFAINIWMKAGNMNGSIFQYLYAHSEFPVTGDSERIQIYLPENEHGLYGLVRALVRDSNDPLSQVYLDSDNLVSNQDFREISSKKIVDGDWHMITLTTHKDQTPGFQVYIDGMLVADHNQENPGVIGEVFGGDPMTLNSRIFVCGRYDEDPNRHFDGRVSQLSLYNVGLGLNEVQKLYKAVMPDAKLPASKPLRIGMPPSTVPEDLDRSECSFPFVYQGVRYYDCALIDGMYECQDANREWALCPETTPQPPPNPECVFPFFYRVQVYNECIPVAGSLKCQNAAGELIECYKKEQQVSPQSPSQNYSSSIFESDQNANFEEVSYCVFPFTYEGNEYNDCIVIAGSLRCIDQSGALIPCHGTSLQQSPVVELSEAELNPECAFPFIYRGAIVTECIDINDQLQCMTKDNRFVTCNETASPSFISELPQAITSLNGTDVKKRTTVDGRECILPQVFRGQVLTDCVDISGVKSCRVQDPDDPQGQVWAECSIEEETRSDVRAAVRYSIEGSQCIIPFTFNNVIYYDCIQQGSVEICPTEQGNYHECVPVSSSSGEQLFSRMTEDGYQCSFPFIFRGGIYNDCVEVSGQQVCKISEDDSFHPCAEEGSGVAGVNVTERYTTDNELCAFPFIYRGEIYTDCVEISGEPRCMTGNNEFKPCLMDLGTEERDLITFGERYTIDGEKCVLPIIYRSQIVSDCINISGKDVCQTESGGDFKECRPLTEELPVVYPQTTVDGYNCTLPFTYQGLVFTECTEIANKLQCKIEEDSDWHECSRSTSASTLLSANNRRTTVDGYQCVFPVIYRGMILEDCAEILGKMQCKIDEDDNWHECEAQIGDVTTSDVITTVGNACVFPFFYRGIIYNQCVEVGDRFLCESETGFFEECMPSNQSLSQQLYGLDVMDAKFTVDGYQCSFPFTYRGEVMRECVEIAGSMNCRIEEDSDWHECAAEVLPEPVNRTTVDGYQCEFPLQFQGQILNDCTLRGEKLKCKIAEDNKWHVCNMTEDPTLHSTFSPRVTLDGEKCMFPFEYRGTIFNDCIQIMGNMQCKIQTDADWHECAPAVQEVSRITVDGLQCKFPTVYRGVVLDDCTDISGKSVCKVEEDDDWHECADTPQLPTSSETVSRTTLEGYECVFPAIYRGQILNDCGEVNGKLQCLVEEDDQWHECAPDIEAVPVGQLTTDGFQCFFPFVYQGIIYTNCVEIENKLQCRISEDDEFHECQPLAGQATTVSSKTRVTTDDLVCVFPTVYRGNVVNDCVEIAGAMQCKVAEDDNWHECAPTNTTNIISTGAKQRRTKDGLTCAFPLAYRQEIYEDCIELGGSLRCKTVEDGQWHECEDVDPEDGTVLRIKKQVTVTGEPCVFPYIYEDVMVTECIEKDGKFQCQTGNQTWQECDVTVPGEIVALSTPTRMTVDGEQCQFPFVYRNVVYTDCVQIMGSSQCTVDGNLKECAPLGTSPRVGQITRANRTTFSGQSCKFPFVYRDQVLYDCVSVAGRDVCQVPNGDLEECAPVETQTSPIVVQDRYTVEGYKCEFPYIWGSKVVTDCVFIGQDESCKVLEDNEWHRCIPAGETPSSRTFSTVNRVTEDGEPCDLPALYRQDIITDCIEIIPGQESCPVLAGGWKNCLPLANTSVIAEPQAITERISVTGDTCIFPFAFRSNIYYDCISLLGQKQCPNSRGEWQVCAPQIAESATLGKTCTVGTYPGEPGWCREGVCAPIFTDSASGEPLVGPNREGQCSTPPVGGAPIWEVSVPTPMAYFPLTGGSVASWPTGQYSGEVFQADWRSDPQFDNTLSCEQGDNDYVKLDNVKYGEMGTLTVSVWIKKRTNDTAAGKAFEYLFSHTDKEGYQAWVENSIQIFLPEENHISHGLVRAILKDEDDIYQERKSEVYIDSDGFIGANFKRNVPGRVDVHDSHWHMITLTTQPNGGPGYRLYIDGVQAAELKPGDVRTPVPGVPSTNDEVVIDGGDPMTMDGDIYLCGRSDLDQDRHFGGSIAHLMLFNVPLLPSQVEDLYNMFFPFTRNYTLTEEDCQDNTVEWSDECLLYFGDTKNVTQRKTQDGDICQLPLIHRGSIHYDCVTIGGTERCKVDGEWQPCEPIGNQPAEIKEVQTFDGRRCIFPFTLNGVEYYECLDVRPDIGYKVCEVEGGDFQACMDFSLFPLDIFEPSPQPQQTPAVRQTEEGGLCEFPLSYIDGEKYYDCILRDGKEMCKNSTGDWNVCLPGIISRQTVSGGDCELPFIYEGTIYNNCTKIDSSDKEKCKSLQTGMMEECKPVEANQSVVLLDQQRFTVKGEKCMAQYQYLGAIVEGCIPFSDGPVCQSESGIWARCSVPRKTIQGESCVFPYTNPETKEEMYQCQWDKDTDKEMCMSNISKQMQECDSTEVQQYPSRITIDGTLCKIPFIMNDTLFTTCTQVGGISVCEDVDGVVEECAEETGPEIQVYPAVMAARTTIQGARCRFPFEFQGRNVTDCVVQSGIEFCEDENGVLNKCAPTESYVLTDKGEICKFPFTLNGKDYYEKDGCAQDEQGMPVCVTSTGKIDTCSQQISPSEQKLQGAEPERSSGSSGGASIAVIVIVSILIFIAVIVIVAGIFYFRRRLYLERQAGGDFKQFKVGGDVERSRSSSLGMFLQSFNSKSALMSWKSAKQADAPAMPEVELPPASSSTLKGNGNGNENVSSNGNNKEEQSQLSVADSAMDNTATSDVPLEDDIEAKKK